MDHQYSVQKKLIHGKQHSHQWQQGFTEGMSVWRGSIITFSLTWNSWTHAVHLSFTYNVECYDPEEKKWDKQ